MIVLVLGLVAFLFLAATPVSILRSRSFPRDDRLASIVEWLEREYSVLRQFDVSEKVEPTIEDRKQQLKEQYVAGEISEAEFERKMKNVMDDAPANEPSPSPRSTTIDIEDHSR